MSDHMIPKDGQLYKAFTVGGHPFELRYGYYDEWEQSLCPPVVIFPDLHAAPLYCGEGYPLVTQIQDICHHYVAANGEDDDWCGGCIHFSGEHREIGICRCEDRKKEETI